MQSLDVARRSPVCDEMRLSVEFVTVGFLGIYAGNIGVTDSRCPGVLMSYA